MAHLSFSGYIYIYSDATEDGHNSQLWKFSQLFEVRMNTGYDAPVTEGCEALVI